MNKHVERLQRIPRWLKNRFAPGGLILSYHRVARLSSDPYAMCIAPEHFAEHLEVLREIGRPMRLQDLSRTVQSGKRPHRAVVITFDDGYFDNLYEAKPLLERYDFPATVFITTGGINARREFWWDELDRLLLQPGALPGKLDLEVNGRKRHFELGDATRYTEAEQSCNAGWSVYEAEEGNPRQRFFRSLYELLSSLSGDEQRRVLDQLTAWAGVEQKRRSTHRTLSADEVQNLATGDLVEIGAHTVTHPKLSTLSAAQQRHEIQQSKTDLEAVVNSPVASFAYPHGDHTPETAALVRTAGFACACTTEVDTIWRNANPFLLPRVRVGDPLVMAGEWNGERFAKLLRWMALG